MQCDESLRAIGKLQTGRSQREVANTFNVSKSVISRLWKRFQQTQNVDDRLQSGRPRATTGVQDRFFRNQALWNRSQTVNQIVANLHQATGVWVMGQRLEIVFMQPILMLDGPEVSLSQQIVTLSTDVNGVGLASEPGYSSLVRCHVVRWVTIQFGFPWQVRSGLATTKWTAH